MNPIGVGLLVGASVLAVFSALNTHDARAARWSVPKRQAVARAAVTTMAAAWCLVVGLWLVVTR